MTALDLPRSALSVRLGTGFYAAALGVLLFAASDPIYPLLMRGPSEWVTDAPGLDGMRRAVWLAIYAAMLALLAAMARHIPRALANQQALALALGWFLLSALWSSDPAEGLIGGVQMAFTTVFGVAIGARIGSAGIVRAVLVAALLCSAATLAFVVLLPEHAFGYHHNPGALRGVYVEKNHLATFLSYGVCAAAVTALHTRALWAWAALALIAALCVAAVSSIALMQLALVFAALGFFTAMRRVPSRGAIALAAALCGLLVLAILLPVVLSSLGEDLTLNGRTTLWAGLWDAVERRPLIGWGYRGYWGTAEADALRAAIGWGAEGAHDVWLQALLWGGAVGLGLWIAVWWGVVARALAILARETDVTRIGVAVLVLQALLWSLFETTQLAHFTHHAIVTGMLLSLRSPMFR